MKTSEIIKGLIDDLSKYGNREIEVDLLTENQSNLVKITGIYSYKNKISIDCDINDIKEFKKQIK